MSGSCHLDRASNVKIGVECQIFVIVIFFNCGRVLQFGAHSRYYKGALTQKRSFLVICTAFRSDFHVSWKNHNKHSTLNSSFDPLSKWHEPDISEINGSMKTQTHIPIDFWPHCVPPSHQKSNIWCSFSEVLVLDSCRFSNEIMIDTTSIFLSFTFRQDFFYHLCKDFKG